VNHPPPVHDPVTRLLARSFVLLFGLYSGSSHPFQSSLCQRHTHKQPLPWETTRAHSSSASTPSETAGPALPHTPAIRCTRYLGSSPTTSMCVSLPLLSSVRRPRRISRPSSSAPHQTMSRCRLNQGATHTRKDLLLLFSPRTIKTDSLTQKLWYAIQILMSMRTSHDLTNCLQYRSRRRGWRCCYRHGQFPAIQYEQCDVGSDDRCGYTPGGGYQQVA